MMMNLQCNATNDAAGTNGTQCLCDPLPSCLQVWWKLMHSRQDSTRRRRAFLSGAYLCGRHQCLSPDKPFKATMLVSYAQVVQITRIPKPGCDALPCWLRGRPETVQCSRRSGSTAQRSTADLGSFVCPHALSKQGTVFGVGENAEKQTRGILSRLPSSADLALAPKAGGKMETVRVEAAARMKGERSRRKGAGIVCGRRCKRGGEGREGVRCLQGGSV